MAKLFKMPIDGPAFAKAAVGADFLLAITGKELRLIVDGLDGMSDDTPDHLGPDLEANKLLRSIEKGPANLRKGPASPKGPANLKRPVKR